MKITDFALIFIAITLPIMIIVYVNVSFTIKAEEQEMYYKRIIDGAIQDATNQMKEVENDDPEIDYGYSGASDKKVSVNAQVGVNTFLNSLYNNFGIKGNEAAEHYLQLFIPAIAIIDYNGVQVSSIEKFPENGTNNVVIKHALKPKKYYTYTYSIIKSGNKYKIVDGVNTSTNSISVHTVEFTMDDYIVHRGYITSSKQDIPTKGFYISDTQEDETNANRPMNISLVAGLSDSVAKTAIDSDSGKYLKDAIVTKLTNIRKDIIVDTIVKEMGHAVNQNNSFARAQGITYDFSFPATTRQEMYNVIENVGMMAFVQGLTVGNKYLNTKSFGTSKLDVATRYYFTVPTANSRFKMNLYHNDKNCPEYRVSVHDKITPTYVITKQQASSAKATYLNGGKNVLVQGFYPCPVCNP